MSVLTIRLSEEEKRSLQRRAKAEKTTTGALVRQLINEKPFATSADLLAEMDALKGDKRLAAKRRS